MSIAAEVARTFAADTDVACAFTVATVPDVDTRILEVVVSVVVDKLVTRPLEAVTAPVTIFVARTVPLTSSAVLADKPTLPIATPPVVDST